MPSVQCPIPDCDYATPDLDPAVVAALITAHATVHTQTAQHTNSSKTEKVRRPTITLGGTAEDWAYFQTRWTEYKQATNLQIKPTSQQMTQQISPKPPQLS